MIRQIKLQCVASEPVEGSLHRNLFGKTANRAYGTYSATFTLEEAHLIRTDELGRAILGQRRLLELSRLSLSGCSNEWPKAWLSSENAPTGDINDSVVAVCFELGNIEVFENIEFLQAFLMNHPLKEPPSSSGKHTPFWNKISANLGFPRVQLAAFVDEMSAKLVLPSPSDQDSSNCVQFHTSTVSLNATSHYYVTFPNKAPKTATTDQHLLGYPILLEYQGSLLTSNVSVTVGSPFLSSEGFPVDEPESVLLVDPIEFSGSGSIMGRTASDQTTVLYLDHDTSAIDMLLASDALSIELWHSQTMESLSYLATVIGNMQRPVTKTSLSVPRPLSRLPFGVSLKVGVRRFTAFVTSSDLNPNDQLELSRGIALRTSISASYSAVKQSSLSQMHAAMMRGQIRQRLKLVEERIIQASAAARASRVTNQEGAFIQVTIRDLRVRPAVATPFAADNPYYDLEEEGTRSKGQVAILDIPSIKIDVTMRTQRTVIGVPDICGINVVLPTLKSSLRLLDVYHILLATKQLKALLRTHPRSQLPKASTPRLMSIACTISATNVQMVVHLPVQQKMYIRIEGLECRLPSTGIKVIQLQRLLCFVPPSSSSKPWQELIRVDGCNVQLPSHSAHPFKFNVDGAARIRVPYGFVLNHFIRGVGVAIKGFKHLAHVVDRGSYVDMEVPAPEGPKIIQMIHVRIRILTFEVADDPLEAKLALLWRAGAGAARVRAERDDAFLAKVAAINGEAAAEAEAAQANPNTAYYHFDARHTIPVKEARDRLLQVHALDWLERHKRAKEVRSNAAEPLLRQMWGEDIVPPALDIRPMIPTAYVGHEPPLLRLRLKDVVVHASPPSFEMARLPDYLYHRGGLPVDTKYSLLVPLHLDVSLTSARLSVREYPIPLLNIPEHDHGEPALNFSTDLVIAEEMGTNHSIDWVDCVLLHADADVYGSEPFAFKIPKTIMPVKTYADPLITVHTQRPTDFAWGVSYAAVTQDLLRVLDTFSAAPLDPSPPVGFWDKVRPLLEFG
jgi:hypothetical protein